MPIMGGSVLLGLSSARGLTTGLCELEAAPGAEPGPSVPTALLLWTHFLHTPECPEMFHPADVQLGCYLPQVGTPAVPLPCGPHSYRGHTGQTQGTAGQPPVPLHQHPELQPPPRTYLDSRLGHLRGRKNRKQQTESKSEQTYLSQAEAKGLQEKPQGQEAPGHGWREQPAAAGAGGREASAAGAPPGPGRVAGIGERLGAGQPRTGCQQRLNPLSCCCRVGHGPRCARSVPPPGWGAGRQPRQPAGHSALGGPAQQHRRLSVTEGLK